MRLRIVLAAIACAAFVGAPSAVAGFPAGQCTYWAYLMRPDIVDDTTLAGSSVSDWTAYRWPANARAGGFRVGAKPAVGAIAVWPRNVLGAGADGHVAYVEQVRADGSFLVSEENYNGSPNVHRRWVQPSSALQFIYLKPGQHPPAGPARLGGELEALASAGDYRAGALGGTRITLDLTAPTTVALRLTGPDVNRRVLWTFRAGGWTVGLDKIAGAGSLPPGTYTVAAFPRVCADLSWRSVSFTLA
jgi:hypothetical protein